MTGSASIAIVGGYGLVGRLLAERLAPRFPSRVVLAGRNRERALVGAAELGNGSRAAYLDASDTDSVQALLGAQRPALVVSCAAGTEPALAQGCLAAGVHYIDVSADTPGITAVEQLHPIAVRCGATAVLSVGVAPGLTNLLAREVCSGLDEVERLDVGVQLSMGDEHGTAAMDWTLANLAAPFSVMHDGIELPQRPFTMQRQLDFGGPSRVRAAGFNFPEQRTLARTLAVPTVRSWLALQPRGVHASAVIAARSGLARLLGSTALRDPLVQMMGRLPHRDGSFAVCAEAVGTRGGQQVRVGAWHSGRGEAAMTAQVADHVVNQVLNGQQRPGVWHIEQLPVAPDLLTAIGTV